MVFHPAQRHKKQGSFSALVPKRRSEALRVSLSLCDHTHIANGPRHSYTSGSSPAFSWTNSFQSICSSVTHHFTKPLPPRTPAAKCRGHVFPIGFLPFLSYIWRNPLPHCFCASACTKLETKKKKSRAEPKNLQNDSAEIPSVILGFLWLWKSLPVWRGTFISVYWHVCFRWESGMF